MLTALLLTAALGLYIQGNFLSGGYPLLTGDGVDWSAMHVRGVLTTCVWVAILAASLFFALKRTPLFCKAARAISVLILGVEAITLVTLLFTLSGVSKDDSKQYYFSSDPIFTFSEKGNIITVVVDALEGKRFEELMEGGEMDVADIFSDFTFYTDVTGVAQSTVPSMTRLLTGSLYPVGVSQQEAVGRCFADATVYDELAALGYDTRVFEFDSFACPQAQGKIQNVQALSSVPRGRVLFTMSKQLYKLVLYRYMPHYCKRFFMKFGLVFSQEEAAFSDQYYVNDLSTWKLLREKGVHADGESKLYSLYHLNGMHSPFRLTRDMTYAAYGDDVPEADRVREQGYGIMALLNDFLNGLRAAGVYENATIIITADHGSRSAYRYAPVLLIKRPGERHALAACADPVSMATDYLPMLLNAAEGADALLPERTAGERTVYRYDLDGLWEGTARSYDEIQVNGNAWELAAYSVDLFE